ncbi:MAG: RsmD family RNA methyltransferase [Christensenellales bacterium]
MRVISGKFKYKQLYAPENNLVRPTTDRIKETLFNILSSKGVRAKLRYSIFLLVAARSG